MMRGVHVAFVLTGVLYFAVALTGYRALGSAAGSNIVLALGNGPMWVRVMARLMVVVHVAAAFQVYAHPAFQSFEMAVGRLVKGSCCGFRVGYDDGSWPSRLVLRTIYVGGCTLVACAIPFFGDLMSLIGAIAITPTTFLLPPLLYLFWRRGQRGPAESALNWTIVGVTGVVGSVGAVSSLYYLIQHAREYRLFGSA
jgi:amino acid permease